MYGNEKATDARPKVSVRETIAYSGKAASHIPKINQTEGITSGINQLLEKGLRSFGTKKYPKNIATLIAQIPKVYSKNITSKAHKLKKNL